jgi:hypothetical protein
MWIEWNGDRQALIDPLRPGLQCSPSGVTWGSAGGAEAVSGLCRFRASRFECVRIRSFGAVEIRGFDVRQADHF